MSLISQKICLTTTKKAIFLSSLYLTQAIPKGYLRFLPILMAEHGESLQKISLIALFSWGDWLKPLFGSMFDLKQVSTLHQRKKIILLIQITVIMIFTFSLLRPTTNFTQLASLFSFCNVLTSIHDTAVDGLAVQILKSTRERAVGGFGQYFGYKLGVLFTSGIFPAIAGDNHRLICAFSLIVMSIVFLFTVSFNVGEESTSPTLIDNTSTSNINYSITSTSSMILSLLQDKWTYINILLLFIYKFADHGLDFIWGPILIKENIQRKTIIKTQFIIGTIAAVLGSFIGSSLSIYFTNSSLALSITSIFRLLPNILQLLFAYMPSFRNQHFIALHSLFENAIGSAVTGAMFSFLLDNSDSQFAATSYALMNTIALVGMSLGEFSFAHFTHSFSFKQACMAGIFINLLFSVLVYQHGRRAKKDRVA
eukprot:gene4107-4396_t